MKLRKGFFGTFSIILAFIFGFIATLVFVYHFRYNLSLTIVETTKWRSDFHYLTQALTLSYEDEWKEEFYENKNIPQNCRNSCERRDDIYTCGCKYKLPINFAISKLYWLGLETDLNELFKEKLPKNGLLWFEKKEGSYWVVSEHDLIEGKEMGEILALTFLLYKQEVPILEGKAEIKFFVLK